MQKELDVLFYLMVRRVGPFQTSKNFILAGADWSKHITSEL